jgi:hypothetical protein
MPTVSSVNIILRARSCMDLSGQRQREVREVSRVFGRDGRFFRSEVGKKVTRDLAPLCWVRYRDRDTCLGVLVLVWMVRSSYGFFSWGLG